MSPGIFNESKFPYVDMFENSTPVSQSTSSSIPFQFPSIPIVQSPNLSQPTSTPSQPTQTHISSTSVHSHSSDADHSPSVSAQSSPIHQPAQSKIEIPTSNPTQLSEHNTTDQSPPITDVSVPGISSEATSSSMDPTSSHRPVNTHPMQTRSMSGIHLPRINPTLLLAHCFFFFLLSQNIYYIHKIVPEVLVKQILEYNS